MPLVTVPLEADRARMAARMGPMQGVQPKAKAKPTTKAPTGDLPPSTECMRLSAYRALILKIPVRCRPKMTITTPATFARIPKYWWVSCPISVATAPRLINTTLKPRMNMMEWPSTVFVSRFPEFLSSSTLAPEIRDTYPGTSGRTHGDRKDISPAKKAAIGNGNEDIRIPLHGCQHCNLSGRNRLS